MCSPGTFPEGLPIYKTARALGNTPFGWAAMGLAAQDDCEVTLSYRKPELLRIKQRNAERIAPLIDSGRVDFRGGTTVAEIQADRVELDGAPGRVVELGPEANGARFTRGDDDGKP